MNKLKLVCVASLLVAGIAQASTPCNGFNINIKNQLADDLVVTQIALHGAEIQPGAIQKINGKTTQAFTVNNSVDNVPMLGDFTFHTISLPSKTVKVKFKLENDGLICKHTDFTVENNDYSVEKTRLPGKIDYSIINK